MGGGALDKSDGSDGSDRSVGDLEDPGEGRRRMLCPSGGYRTLRSFQATTVIYDATVSFCDRFVDKRSRTVDQMVQAARSGRQNIAEGSRASSTSSQTELRLVNVARASLDELLLDYEDFLRQRGLRAWEKDDPQARAVRAIGRVRPSKRADQTNSTAGSEYACWLRHADPSVVANAVICLIYQAAYLLDRQIVALEQQFIREGGYSENLTAARRAARQNQAPGDPVDQSRPQAKPAPACPICGGAMTARTARQGMNAGSTFWGCVGYPSCKGTRRLEAGKSNR
jgi:restriction system protein